MADFGGEIFSKYKGVSDREEDMVGVIRSNDREDLGRFEKRENVVVDGRASQEEGFEVETEGSCWAMHSWRIHAIVFTSMRDLIWERDSGVPNMIENCWWCYYSGCWWVVGEGVVRVMA